MTYTVFIERSAQRSLAKITQPQRDRIIGAVRRLVDNPRPAGTKKLSDRDAWRIRVGNYRVIYEIRDDDLVVLVISVGHRRDVYRR